MTPKMEHTIIAMLTVKGFTAEKIAKGITFAGSTFQSEYTAP